MSISTGKVLAQFGRLWSRSHESFRPDARRIISVSGPGATAYLQNLVTCDLTQPPPPPRPEDHDYEYIQPPQSTNDQSTQPPAAPQFRVEFSDQLRAACFLDPKGRIVTDALLWKLDANSYYIDCPGPSADALLHHLQQFKLRRSRVEIRDTTADMTCHVIFGSLNASGAPPGFLSHLDPRHPSLGIRVLGLPSTLSLEDRHAAFAQRLMTSRPPFPASPGTYDVVRRLAGVAEGPELRGRVSAECNQEFLRAVSFHKGCYLGQELTSRVQHVGVLRKRILPLILLDTATEIPRPWVLASSLQEGRAKKQFTIKELKELPTRLPRVSAVTAAHLVAMTTGITYQKTNVTMDELGKLDNVVEYYEQDGDDEELRRAQERADQLLERIQDACQPGAKIIDARHDTGKTIGQIVSQPALGTNVVLALMRLESTGLLSGSGKVWSKLNKVTIGDSEHYFRYLPYLPLWWPEIDHTTGKARETAKTSNVDDDDEEEDDSYYEAEAAAEGGAESEYSTIVLEEIAHNENDKNTANGGAESGYSTDVVHNEGDKENKQSKRND